MNPLLRKLLTLIFSQTKGLIPLALFSPFLVFPLFKMPIQIGTLMFSTGLSIVVATILASIRNWEALSSKLLCPFDFIMLSIITLGWVISEPQLVLLGFIVSFFSILDISPRVRYSLGIRSFE